jgi:replicative DNA helicase
MTRSGLNVDLIGLTGHLRARDSLEAVGGPLTLSELASDAPTPKMLPHYLSVLEEAEKRRRVIRACHKLGADAHDPDNPVNQLIQQGDDLFTDLLKTASVARERAWTEVLGKTIHKLRPRDQPVGNYQGYQPDSIRSTIRQTDTEMGKCG